MTRQQYSIHLPIASSTEIEHTARRLKKMREEFLTSGAASQHLPRRMIMDSWQRCRAMQVNAALRYAPLAITQEAQLQIAREAAQQLIHAAQPVMKYLADALAGSGYVVVLSDAAGCLLDVIGDKKVRRHLERIDFGPGGDWSEAAAGTNALGTAIADGHVVQLLGAEHYCEGWQDLTCTAAPIRHPQTGEVIGILDTTGNYRLIRPFLSCFVATMALHVEQEMARLSVARPTVGPGQPQELRPSRLPVGLDANGEPGQSQRLRPYRVRDHATAMPAQSRSRDPVREKPEKSAEESQHSLLENLESSMLHGELLTAAMSTISASLDIDITLEKVAEQTAYMLQLNSAAVYLFSKNGEPEELHIWSKQRRRRTELRAVLEVLLQQTEVVSLLEERGELVVIDDMRIAAVSQPNILTEQSGIRSLLLLPLITACGVIGFIMTPRYTRAPWTVNDMLPGLMFAAHAATVIENARSFSLLQRHTRRAEVLSSLTQLLRMAPDPGQHLDLFLKRIVKTMDLDVGIILLYDQHADRLMLAAHVGLPENVQPDLCLQPLRSFYKVATQVITKGKTHISCSIEKNDNNIHKLLSSIGFCDVMVVPLANGNTNVGVLLVGSREHQRQTTEDLVLLTTIGQQLGMALTNARLQRSVNETEALQEAERLKSKFVTAVSHDLQSPLTAIRASVEGLLNWGEMRSSDLQKHLLNTIAGQTNRLDQLVSQLLDLSRIEAGRLALDCDWIELPIVIADTAAKFEELYEGYRIERELADDLPLPYVDRDRFVQVLWNLLENARKYALPSALIKVEARWEGNEVQIGVADRGPGIPAEERERIFQHFYRLRRDQETTAEGSGLGLAICQGIVQAHGGRIWVEDRPGGGSVFRFALPLSPAELAGIEPDCMSIEGK